MGHVSLNAFFEYWRIAIYSVALVSVVQQSDSVLNIHVSILFQVLSHSAHYRILVRVPCALH